MVRHKINIKRIENAVNRQITFTKRRGGLLKKAHDLSVLCEAETAVIIFSSKGKLFEFASSSMPEILEKYIQHHEELKASRILIDYKNDQEVKRLIKQIQSLKLIQGHFLGEDLDGLSLKELVKLEEQLHTGLCHIRAKKDELLLEHLEDIKEKVAVVQRIANANSTLVSNLIKSHPSEATGVEESHGIEHTFAHQSRQPKLKEPLTTDGSPKLCRSESREQSSRTHFSKRPIMSADLNRSPGWLDNI